MNETQNSTESSGVQQLIDRLHNEAVVKGQSEADNLVTAARQESLRIVDQAKLDAKRIIADAEEQANKTLTSGNDAIRQAGRDAVLELMDEMREDFFRQLEMLIGESFDDVEFLKRLISQIAGHLVPSNTEGPLLLQLLDTPPEHDDELAEFMKSFTHSALRKGISVEFADSAVKGMRVKLLNDNIEIDLTSETLMYLLKKHLHPRVRRLLDE